MTIKQDHGKKENLPDDSGLMARIMSTILKSTPPMGFSFHRGGSHQFGHKGQQAKAVTKRRRLNQIARLSRRKNR